MDGIISAAARVAKVHLRNDDDLVDRLHHRYTVLFLVIFTAVVSTTQYVGDPISCWCPAYFTENHVDYTNKVLFQSSVLSLALYNNCDLWLGSCTEFVIWDHRSKLGCKPVMESGTQSPQRGSGRVEVYFGLSMWEG